MSPQGASLRADLLAPTHTPRCPVCDRGVGLTVEPVIVTGVVKRHPREPDGLAYSQCANCRSFVRLEVVPPSAKVA